MYPLQEWSKITAAGDLFYYPASKDCEDSLNAWFGLFTPSEVFAGHLCW